MLLWRHTLYPYKNITHLFYSVIIVKLVDKLFIINGIQLNEPRKKNQNLFFTKNVDSNLMVLCKLPIYIFNIFVLIKPLLVS